MKRQIEHENENETKKSRIFTDEQLFEILGQLSELLQVENLNIEALSILAVGDQGAGKSSLLNRLIGADLLPARSYTDNNDGSNLKAKTL